MKSLARGDRGQAVLDIQARLGSLGYHIELHEHGDFGPTTEQAVREFQQRRQLLVDGRVGDLTWQELVEASYSLGDRSLYLRYPPYRGDDVRELQAALNMLGFDAGREDGIFGARTERGVREFQRNVGLPVDGIVGTTTVDALARVRPRSKGPGRAQVREGEAMRRLSATLQGARVAVDAGRGAGDPGAKGPAGTIEAEATLLMAAELANELVGRGANPRILRAAWDNPSDSERARQANQFGAEVLVGMYLNSHIDSAAEGCSTYYYGREEWFSRAGQRLAELIQDELTQRLELKNGRTHPKALPLLRETQMPAVHVEPCFLTNPREEKLLADPRFRREVARCIADALERFFGGRATDRPRHEATS